MRRDGVAGVKQPVAFRQQQVSFFDAVGLSVKKPARPRKPTAGLCEFSINEQREPQPECATRGVLGISATEESLVRTRQKIAALNFFSDQQGGLCEIKEILCRQ